MFQTHGQDTPFLFFSETACAGNIWNKFQVPEFSRDHVVITHDYRGTGKSSKPTTQYSYKEATRLTGNIPPMSRGAHNGLTPNRRVDQSALRFAPIGCSL